MFILTVSTYDNKANYFEEGTTFDTMPEGVPPARFREIETSKSLDDMTKEELRTIGKEKGIPKWHLMSRETLLKALKK